jgi:ParB family chromosome partitioning protein
MADKRRALGRGLGALIPGAATPPPSPPPAVEPATRTPVELDIDLLAPNPRQPRLEIESADLDQLAESIRAHGVIQPVVVRRIGDRHEIVAGERRWRAAQRAGLLKVPVVVRDVADAQLLEIALVENVQREDLNPIEEAKAYRRLADELGMSQEAIAAAVSKDRATVANYLRLLNLPAEVQAAVAGGELSMGHARALLGLSDETAQRRLARETIRRRLSVREVENLVRREANPQPDPAPRVADPNTRAAEERLKLALGTRVRIARRGGRGRIEIEFANEHELQRLFEQLTSP